MSDLRRLIGQLMIVGFEGHQPSQEIISLIRDYHVGNVILFVRNVDNADQLLELTKSLQQIAKDAGHEHPLFISIDQENGLVSRLRQPLVPQFPGAMALGAIGSPQAAYDSYKATGEYLRYYGIQFDYAPVADINSNPDNPVVGVRSFGDDPAKVSELVDASLRGLKDSKVVTSVKHFPGHGDTAIDSHHGTALIEKDIAILEKCELVPFKNCHEAESIMMAHVIIPALGDDLPCSISPSAIKYLKETLNYNGLVITDCLTMNAVSESFGVANSAVRCLQVGADCPMVCHHYDLQVESIEKIEEEVSKGNISQAQLESSLKKVNALKEKYLSWEDALADRNPDSLVNFAKHEQLIRSLYAKSTTVVRKDPSLPFKKGETVAYIIPSKPKGNAVSGAVNNNIRYATQYIPPSFERALSLRGIQVVQCGYGPDDDVASHDETIAKADRILVVSRNAHLQTFQKDVVQHIAKHKKPLSVVGVDVPYDYMKKEDEKLVPTYICTYEPTVEAFDAALDVLFGEAEGSTGVCPVKF